MGGPSPPSQLIRSTCVAVTFLVCAAFVIFEPQVYKNWKGGGQPSGQPDYALVGLKMPTGSEALSEWADLPICGKRKKPWVIHQAWASTLSENRVHPVHFVNGHPPFRMKLRPSTFDERMWMRLLTEQEYIYQVAVIRMVVRKVVGPSEQCSVVDIGANAGYISMAAASLGCRVDSMEASPANAENARRSFLANENAGTRVTLHHAAVSKTPGSVAFAYLRTGSIYDRMVSDEDAIKMAGKKDGDFGKFTVTRVQTKTVHELIGSRIVHFLKLDCEGCEAQAIETMAPLLQRGLIKIILSEWITSRINKVSGPKSLQAAVELLRANNYTCFHFNGQSVDYNYVTLAKTEVGDLFFVHRSVVNFGALVSESGGVLEEWNALKQCSK